jgi:predicted kinase
MLVGIPCVGKSYWVEQQKFNPEKVVIVSTDKLIKDYADSEGKTYNEVFASYYNTAKKLMDEQIAKAIENNHDIVWDQTNISIASRSGKLKQIPESYTKIALVFKVPNEKKHTKLLKERVDKVISQQVIKTMKESYEEPKISEGFDCIQWVDAWKK